VPIRFVNGSILFNNGQIVIRDDNDPSCCCPPPECCDGNPVASTVYMDVSGWVDGVCHSPPYCSALNGTGFVLPYITSDGYACHFQYTQTLNLCGVGNALYVLRCSVHQWPGGTPRAAMYAGFSDNDHLGDDGLYSYPWSAWFVEGDIDACNDFDLTVTRQGNIGSIYGTCYVSTYNIYRYMRAYT